MDTVLEKIERLAELARREPSPDPLDAGRIMATIRGLDIEAEPEALPMIPFLGGLAAAAAAAAVIIFFALPAWSDLSSPMTLLSQLPEALDIL